MPRSKSRPQALLERRHHRMHSLRPGRINSDQPRDPWGTEGSEATAQNVLVLKGSPFVYLTP